MARMTRLVAAIFLCVGLVGLVGCDDDDDNKVTPDATVDAGMDVDMEVADMGEEAAVDTMPQKTEPTTFMDYNAGLIAAVVFDRERKPEIIKALKTVTDIDVLCLNEVWLDGDPFLFDDVGDFMDGLKELYPYSFYYKSEDPSEPVKHCQDLMALLGLQSCVQDKCTPEGISFEECALDENLCKAKVDVLTPECLLCVAANLQDMKPEVCGTSGGNLYSADGRNGLILMSKLPIKDPKYTDIDTIMVKRGFISATIGSSGVICTHLPTFVAQVQYIPGITKYNTWEEENRGALDTLYAVSEELGDGCKVLMGDLNTGPEIPEKNLEWMFSDNYQEILDYGYEEPWDDPQCTYCNDNSVAGPYYNMWIDHIMFKDCDPSQICSSNYEIILKQDIQIVDRFGVEHTTKLTDHYGLRCSVETP